jgi:hypothetical protein
MNPASRSIGPNPARFAATVMNAMLLPAHRRTAAGLVFAAIVCFALTGCIRSRALITSEPSGAEVYFEGLPRGVTPIEIPFNWYWEYEVALEKKGYKRLETTERFRTPPWFLMPLDLVAELLPVPIPDRRDRHYVLEAEEIVP